MFNHKFVNSIEDVSPHDWAQLCTDNLFCSYPWLKAFEQSQCVHSSCGWQPHHLLIYHTQQLIAILPGYLKGHSYGEYVFDWSWAEAYQRYGLNYYPKWLCGVPFTPVTGQRILCKNLTAELTEYICVTLKETCAAYSWSGAHINFFTDNISPSRDFITRHGVQFHWFNNKYKDFTDFLNALTSRRRKMIKKERQQAQRYKLTIRWLTADQIDNLVLARFFQCYQSTYIKRSGHQGYLNLTFFKEVLNTMPHIVRLCAAFDDQKLVAASFYLCDDHTLYGRYWGALEAYQSLHFELCYYQGIEYAIKYNLNKFDAGAQGEHKLTRGFQPVTTYSMHHIAHPVFGPAIADFIQREKVHIEQYKDQCAQVLPFKQQ